LRRPHGPGWALVGDAGWWKDPLSTYGITDAFRDAELVARAVVVGAASDHAMRIALCRYQAERDRLALPMHPIVDRSPPTSGTWPKSNSCSAGSPP
jgi:flavin-dependent dehydrogenase